VSERATLSRHAEPSAPGDRPPLLTDAVPPAFRRGVRRLLGLLAVLLVTGIGVATAFVLASAGWPWAAAEQSTAPATGTPAAPTPPDRPTPGIDSAGTPVGNPLPAPREGGSYEFVSLQVDGLTPVAYDPCRPVHYVVRPGLAPDGGAEVLALAARRLSELTGLKFVDDGVTDEAAVAGRASFQPERYGDRWAPVLISWDTEEENPGLAGEVVGLAGSTWRSLGDGPRVYVTGAVSLDAPQLDDVLSRRNGRELAVAVVAHELGHLVGLGHVDDVGELMYPEARLERTDFGPGDRTGLARLGSGLCAPQL
jgi:hypothetical protein